MDNVKKEFIDKAMAAGFTESQAEFMWKEFGGGQWEGVSIA